MQEIAPDFELVDAWALPASGDRVEFDDLCDVFVNLDDEAGTTSGPSKALFAVRTWLGARFGWDDDINTLPIPGCSESTLRDRLPDDLPAAPDDPAGRLPFRPVFRTENEWALELSNSTVHAILHLAWVPQPDNTYRGQLGVYVKHRGRLGRPYMAAIAPFRHYIVYPALLRRIEKGWLAREPRRGVIAVIHSEGRFLWIKRGAEVVKPGYWAPPGGKIEPGESAADTLVREMREELGIEVKPLRPVWQCPTEDGAFTLEWWLAEIVAGKPHVVDGEVAEVTWVTAEQIHDLTPTFASHLHFIDEVWPTLTIS